jgi:hypothetical protein
MDARPRELAVRMAHADEQIFTLPLEAARCRVREIIRQPSKNGLICGLRTVVGRQLKFSGCRRA